MSFFIVLGALCFLMLVAYRGFSVILFAPVAALGAVLLTDPSAVLPVYSGLFMDKMVVFVKLYFPVFLLGAVFGKVIELSGFSRSIVASTMRLVGRERAVLAIVIVCAVLTYGGVSLFVVVFAVYPFAAEAVPPGCDTEAADPRHDRARRLHLHHGRLARHAADPEHHPLRLLQDHHLGGALARADRRRLHRRLRHGLSDLAHPAGGRGGRGLRRPAICWSPSRFPTQSCRTRRSPCCRWSSSA